MRRSPRKIDVDSPPAKRANMFDEGYVADPLPNIPDKSKEPRCANTWERGIDYTEPPDYPVVMKPTANCTIPIGDKIAYVSLPTDLKWLDVYLKTIERLTPDQLADRNGIFTWIFYRTAGSTGVHFAASQVRSMFEVGTLHRAIAKSVGATTIHGAGEMKKVGKKIDFNFMSGSYVLPWIKKKNVSCSLPEMEEYLEPVFRKWFPEMTLTRRSGEFIGQEETPATMEELQLYADAHFIVCIHEKNEGEKCKQTKGTCDSPLKSRL